MRHDDGLPNAGRAAETSGTLCGNWTGTRRCAPGTLDRWRAGALARFRSSSRDRAAPIVMHGGRRRDTIWGKQERRVQPEGRRIWWKRRGPETLVPGTIGGTGGTEARGNPRHPDRGCRGKRQKAKFSQPQNSRTDHYRKANIRVSQWSGFGRVVPVAGKASFRRLCLLMLTPTRLRSLCPMKSCAW